MKKIGNKWEAENGFVFVQRFDGTVMGESVFLGIGDAIDNYVERPATAEEKAAVESSLAVEVSFDVEAPHSIDTNDNLDF